MTSESASTGATPPIDVLIVGFGPVGQVLSVLLAQRGHRVTVVERWPEPYPMPRAVSFDGESARVLASAGAGPAIREFGEPSRDYTWTTANGDVLLQVDVADPGCFGWPDSTSMYQPGLESSLAERAGELPTLEVLRGVRAERLRMSGGSVELSVEGRAGETWQLTASWVVGCDGANSFVRAAMGADWTDLGFSNDWLTCDVVVHDGREFNPNNLQVCDPLRPATVVSAGPGHRRWEFMRLPAEPIGRLHERETVWRLLGAYAITPDNATLERHAVYTFHACYAQRWRTGRVLLAGDAAHLMPPFAGQGMCSGFRDAANLAWKLDLVLAGTADEALLDTYEQERRAHVQHALQISVDLGKVICQTDVKAARDRDEVMIAARERGLSGVRPRSSVQALTTGLLADDRRRPVGELMPQGVVTTASGTGLLDDVFGGGFVLLVRDDATGVLDCGLPASLLRVGTRAAVLLDEDREINGGRGEPTVDVEGTHRAFLGEAGVGAVLVRPDFYIFGAANDADELASLGKQLEVGLAPTPGRKS